MNAKGRAAALISQYDNRTQRNPQPFEWRESVLELLSALTQAETSLKKVQGIANAQVSRHAAMQNQARQAGRMDAAKSWEEGWKFGKQMEKLRSNENAAFTAEIMKLEEQIADLTDRCRSISKLVPVYDGGCSLPLRVEKLITSLEQDNLALKRDNDMLRYNTRRCCRTNQAR